MFGLHQAIEVGHMGGRSNVIFWLKYRNIEPEEGLVDSIFDAAKATSRVLTDEEVMSLVESYLSTSSSSSAESSNVPAGSA